MEHSGDGNSFSPSGFDDTTIRLETENGDKPDVAVLAKPAIDVDSDGFLGRDLFIKATKKPARIKVLTFPEGTEWAGAKHRIKALKSGERDRVEGSMMKGKGEDRQIVSDDLRAKYIIAASVNADGTPMFNLKQDLKQVSDMPGSCADFLYDEIIALARAKKKDDDDALGNSTGTDGAS